MTPSSFKPLHTIKYGTHESQLADLYLPHKPHPAVICLLHGGFWRMPYGREEMARIAVDWVTRGFAVLNMEYRRVGEAGGGWPGTLNDVETGINHLAHLISEGIDLNLNKIILMGHSAGSHLALLAAANLENSRHSNYPFNLKISTVVGLAPIVDLSSAYALGLGKNAANAFIGGSPLQYPAQYMAASPLTPFSVKKLIIHGVIDETIPVEFSREYIKMQTESDNNIHYIELPDAGHMDYLDPTSKAHHVLCQWILTQYPPS